MCICLVFSVDSQSSECATQSWNSKALKLNFYAALEGQGYKANISRPEFHSYTCCSDNLSSSMSLQHGLVYICSETLASKVLP